MLATHFSGESFVSLGYRSSMNPFDHHWRGIAYLEEPKFQVLETTGVEL
jgi:hypothetical protein